MLNVITPYLRHIQIQNLPSCLTLPSCYPVRVFFGICVYIYIWEITLEPGREFVPSPDTKTNSQMENRKLTWHQRDHICFQQWPRLYWGVHADEALLPSSSKLQKTPEGKKKFCLEITWFMLQWKIYKIKCCINKMFESRCAIWPKSYILMYVISYQDDNTTEHFFVNSKKNK